MSFFNAIATIGLGENNDVLHQEERFYGQANVSININPLNGNLFVKDFTKAFVDQGFEFELGYRYNSLSANPWALNQGKTIGPIQGELHEAGSWLAVEESDGHHSIYTYDASRGGYVKLSEAGGSSVLTYTPEGTWQGWNPATNQRELYNQKNQLARQTDHSGNHLSYEYDTLGRLIVIKGNSGSRALIAYGEQIIKIYAVEGEQKAVVMQYVFDQHQRLKTTQIPLENEAYYELHYDYSEASGLLSHLRQSDGTQVHFEYQIHEGIYCLSSLSQGEEQPFTLVYQERETVLIDPLDHKEYFVSNEDGLLRRHQVHEQYQDYSYDSAHRIKTITYQDQSFKHYDYDALGCYSAITEREGEKIRYYRDAETGLLLCTTQVLADGQIDHNLNHFHLYNEQQDLIFDIEPTGAVYAYQHDRFGNKVSEKIYLDAPFDVSLLTANSRIDLHEVISWCAAQHQAATTLSEWRYNAYGQKSSQTVYASIDEQGQGVIDECTAYEEYEWNGHAELLSTKKKLNATETAMTYSRYDALSRLLESTNALGHKTFHRYQGNTHQTVFEPTGLTTTLTWNKAGLTIQKEERALDCSRVDYLTYDKAARLYKIAREGGGANYFVYDKYHRLAYELDPILRVIKHDYDTNNNSLHQWRYKETIAFVDENALQQGLWQPKVKGEYALESTFHNASGQLVCSIDAENFVITHHYNSLHDEIETITYATPLSLPSEQRATLTQPPPILPSEQDRHHRYFYNMARHKIGERKPSGHVIMYGRNARGDVLTQISTLGSVGEILDGQFEVVTQVPHKKEAFVLNARGHCLCYIDAESIEHMQQFDAGGRCVERRYADVWQILAWDALDRPIKDEQSNGLTKEISYAPCGETASKTQRDVLADTAPRAHHQRYNGLGQLTYELRPRVALKLSHPDVAKEETLTESLWQQDSVQHKYDNLGNKTSSSDELGNTSYFYYNAANELRFTINPTGSITEHTYDAVVRRCDSTRYYAQCLQEDELLFLTGGQLTSALLALFHSYQSASDAIEQTQFTPRGLPYRLIDAEEFETHYKYDAFHNLVKSSQDRDKTHQLLCTLAYDKNDRLIEKIKDVGGINATESWCYKDDQGLVVYTDANQNPHQTYHDGLGRIIRKVTPLGHETRHVWDKLSRLIVTLDALGSVTEKQYEYYGRRVITTCGGMSDIEERNAFDELERQQNADGEVWQTIYDVDGQVKQHIKPDGYRQDKEFNHAGWMQRTIEPNNKITHYTHNKSGWVVQQRENGEQEARIVTLKHDAQGREILRIDTHASAVQTVYDRRGLTSQEIIDPQGVALSICKAYDGLKNPVLEIKGSADYPNQLTTQWVRNALGDLVSTVVDPDRIQLTTTIQRNALGQEIALTDANGHTTHFCPDADGLVRYTIDPMGAVLGKWYDAKGRCIEERYYARTLDVANITDFSLAHLESLLLSLTSQRVADFDEHDKVFYYTYDEQDNKIATLNEQGGLTRSLFNAQGKEIYNIRYAAPISTAELMQKGYPQRSDKDRESAWFYDGNGNERFAINSEGFVIEQCWNEHGWLMERRVYARPWLDYNACPDRAQLAHPDDRITYYLYDEFGRTIFEINPEGYVTEHAYEGGEQPTTTWFYPQKIALPNLLNLRAVSALLPNKEDIPHQQIQYDGAARKIAMTDQLNYEEHFKLDALNNLREYLDKGNDSWIFEIDSAGRKTEEATPPVDYTWVTEEGAVVHSQGKQRLVKKTEYHGDVQRITEAYGTPEARVIEFHHNPCNDVEAIVQPAVQVYDKEKKPTGLFAEYSQDHEVSKTNTKAFIQQRRPESSKNLSVLTRFNAFKKPMVIINEAGHPHFKVYQAATLCYEVDEEGFVTEYKSNLFGNIEQVIRYANALPLDLTQYLETGISLSLLKASLVVKPDEDRSITRVFDKINRPIKTIQDAVFMALPQSQGPTQYGNYAPIMMQEYNAFGDIECHKELVDPTKERWAINRTWFNKNSRPVAVLDALDYLTIYSPDRYGNNKTSIEYATPLKHAIQAHCPIDSLLQAVELNKEQDRLYTTEINARGEVIQSSQHHVQLYHPTLSLDTIRIPVLSGDQTVTHQLEYNAKGLVIKETFPNGAYQIKEYDARNLPILKTYPSRQLEHTRATPVSTTAYNAFAQPSQLIHHQNPYENEAYRTPAPDDQVYLTGYNARGLQTITINPEGAVQCQSFTATKTLALSWIWVTGWGDKAQKIRRLHQSTYCHDKRGIETYRCESIEQGSSVTTVTHSNAFGEKITQGAESGESPWYWLRDKTGAVWNTNEQNGVPLITLRNAQGKETLNLRSRTRALQKITSPSQLNALVVLDYKEIQSMTLQRDLKGRIEAQHLPAFSTLKPDEPEPYYTEVSSGPGYPEFGAVSLSWPIPDIAGLEAEVCIWPKGKEEAIQTLTLKTTALRQGVDLSQVPTDHYHYRIDFYYRNPFNEQRDAHPRYRTEGDSFIITEIVLPTANLVWHQIDEQHVMFYGALGDISGVELRQSGVPIARVALGSTDKPHCWRLDLSEQPSGRYEFHLLRGYSLLEEEPIKIGKTSAKGTFTQTIATHLSQSVSLDPHHLNAVVKSSWNAVPPHLNTLYHELIVMNASSTRPPTKSIYTSYTTETSDLSVARAVGSHAHTIQNHFTSGAYSFGQFSATVVRNRLYTIDSSHTKKTVAEVLNPLTEVGFNSAYLYVQPGPTLAPVHALRERLADGHLGKTIALTDWMEKSSRCAAALIHNDTAYDLISLQSTTVEPHPYGELTLHTANTQSKQLLVREIPLTQVMGSKVLTGSTIRLAGYTIRDAIHFKWTLPDFLNNNPVKVSFAVGFNHPAYTKAYGAQYRFEYLVGRSAYTPYNGHLLPLDIFGAAYTPAFSDFNLKSLKLSVQYNNDWIPLLNANVSMLDRSVHSNAYSMRIESPDGPQNISQYKEGDIAHFEDTYTLLFYPLPANLDANTITLEYYDTSLGEPTWRSLAAQYTGHALAVSCQALRPGRYQYRLKSNVIGAASADFSTLAERVEEGWAIGHFTVTHGAQLATVHHPKPQMGVVSPVRRQSQDRWGNIISSSDTLGRTTFTTYNGVNKKLQTIQPEIEVVDEHGRPSLIAPTSHWIYDLNNQVVAFVDPNAHSTYHERDYDGAVLKTTLADKVSQRITRDLFGRPLMSTDALNNKTRHQYNRCNKEVLLQDACDWPTVFRYNELGSRLEMTNGNQEKERYDYLDPSGQVSHHYLPEGDNYRTIKEYDEQGVLIRDTLADGRSNTWGVDAFGNTTSHRDLSGAVTEYTRNPNYPTEVLAIKGAGGCHGNRRTSDGALVPIDNKSETYQYDEASQVVAILDDALPLTTLYRYDLEGRQARETFIAHDGHIHQAVLMRWNALNWLSEVQDTQVAVRYLHDAKGNRRATLPRVFWNGVWQALGEGRWYTYNAADRMIVNQGALIDETIQIVAEQGSSLSYDEAGRRMHERKLNSQGLLNDKTLAYKANNLLSDITSTNGDYVHDTYDKQVARRKTRTTNTAKHESHYNDNGWVLSEMYQDKVQKTHAKTIYDLNRQGNIIGQKTTVRSEGDSDGYDDDITIEYAAFDMDKVALMRGVRQRLHGERTESTVNVHYDPNGNTEWVLENGQEPRHFITNSRGRIVKKTKGEGNEGHYFYTTSGQPLGYFGTLPREGLHNPLTYTDFDLNYHPVSEQFPAPTSGHYIVQDGDDFIAIAERMYGDASFANVIAQDNGYSEEDKPTPGLTLRIPSLVNTNVHNWEGIYPPYNSNAIIGSLYPNMPMPLRRANALAQPTTHKRGRFWHVLVEALTGVVVMTFAPEFAGALSGVFHSLLSEVLGFAVAGAASSLAQQELAIHFGEQNKLAWNRIGQSALLAAGTAGIVKGLKVDLLQSSQHNDLWHAATKNIELTLATQGLSFVIGEQRHVDWRSLLASLANSVVNAGMQQNHLSVPLFNDALATASSAVTSIGVDVLLGKEIDAETIAANTLGTFIGNQVAAIARQRYVEYQAQKTAYTNQWLSQIPTVKESLAQSEHQFLNTLRIAETPIGHIDEEVTVRQSPTRSPPTHAASKPSSHNLPHEEHLKAKHAQEDAARKQASHWAKANSHTPTQSKASAHGFWGRPSSTRHANLATNNQVSLGRIASASPFVDRPYEQLIEEQNLGSLLGVSPAVNDLLSSTSSKISFFGQGKYNIEYAMLPGIRGGAYLRQQVIKQSHYYFTPGSPIAGDASKALQMRSIDAIITAAKKAHLNAIETAHLLAIANKESGFNPYAAAGSSTATGLGQFTNDTWKEAWATVKSAHPRRWNIDDQATALVMRFRAIQQELGKHVGLTEDYIYKLHHDGINCLEHMEHDDKRIGLMLSRRDVYPRIGPNSEFIKKAF